MLPSRLGVDQSSALRFRWTPAEGRGVSHRPVARTAARRVKTLAEVRPEIERRLIVEGLQDAFGSAEPLLTAAEVKAALAELQGEYRARRTETVRQLGEKNGREGEAFLAENKTREAVVMLPSGLHPAERVGARPALDHRH